MRDVIEAGREASPLVNEGLAEMRAKVDSFRQLLSDLSSIRCEAAREAVLQECMRSVDSLSGTLVDTASKWDRFDSALVAYKYKFRRVKITLAKDMPGQQMLFDAPSDATSPQGETGSP